MEKSIIENKFTQFNCLENNVFYDIRTCFNHCIQDFSDTTWNDNEVSCFNNCLSKQMGLVDMYVQELSLN